MESSYAEGSLTKHPSFGGLAGWLNCGGKMAAYVAILIDRFIASGGPFPRHLVGAAAARCEVAGG
jgi:hypothetical protein